MSGLPSHILPNYSEEARQDALFHYTTGLGLVGIVENNELWCTSYHCSNDEHELAAGRGALTPLFRHEMHRLEEANDARITKFARRGVDSFEYADNFEEHIIALAFSSLATYIACFCIPVGKEDFLHGLLSQWRGYGVDGGYAIQVSRRKLVAAIERTRKAESLNYELQDVHYTKDNVHKAAVLEHSDAFLSTFQQYLDDLAQPLGVDRAWRNPLAGSLNGPLESLIDYRIQTKNSHFSEERECRLSLVQLASKVSGERPVRHFVRSGLVVPYTTTPPSIDILGCIEWVVIGPGPRMNARFKSVTQLVRQSGREIRVRASHIPFHRS